MKKLLITLSLAAASICQAEPIQISITGTADRSAVGYTAGQSYTFNWEINGAYTGNSGDSFISSNNRWWESKAGDSMLFSSFSGGGLAGTLTQPSGPRSFIELIGTGSYKHLTLAAGSTSGNLGMTVNGEELTSLYADSIYIPTSELSEIYTDPTVFFASNAGSYTSFGEMRVVGASGFVYFDATNVTIGAIPEPASLGLISLFSGGIWFMRRYQFI